MPSHCPTYGPLRFESCGANDMDLLVEFRRLRSYYDLDRKLCIHFDSYMEAEGVFRGWYISSRKIIILPFRFIGGATAPRRALTLLHEICHAIQDREGRLVEDVQVTEDEAVCWAAFKYKKHFRRLGPLPPDAFVSPIVRSKYEITEAAIQRSSTHRRKVG